MLSRRSFVKGAAVAAVGSIVGRPPLPVAASASKVSRQVPGYFRLEVGDFEITALYDGGLFNDPKILHGATPGEIAALLKAAGFWTKGGQYPIPINAFLINSGRNLILVDTGAGANFGGKAGLLPSNLRAAGYDPGQIDTVLLTHLHSDHAMGLADQAGHPVFPNATVRVHEAEAAYWLDKNAGVRAAVAPYKAAGAFATFATGATPVSGVEAEPVIGHTPGHCCYRVRSRGENILFWGDIVHCLPVQFPRPEVSIDFDVDQHAAVAARNQLMAAATEEKCWVAGAHLPFPGIGLLQASPPGYQWWPALYAVQPSA